MKLVNEKRCISEIRNKIEHARNNVQVFEHDGKKEFESVYDYMKFAFECKMLKRKTIDILWRELQEATSK